MYFIFKQQLFFVLTEYVNNLIFLNKLTLGISFKLKKKFKNLRNTILFFIMFYIF